jgi:hypothetical protein
MLQRQRQRQQVGRKSTGSEFMSWLEEQQAPGSQQQQQHQQYSSQQQQQTDAAGLYGGVRGQPQGRTAAAGMGRGAGSSMGGYGYMLDGVIPDSEQEDDVIVLD